MTNSSYRRSIAFVVAFLGLTVTMAMAQSVAAYDGRADDLSSGTSYRIYVDDSLATQVIPRLNGNEHALAVKFIVTASPGTKVTVNFVLPSVLSGSSGNIPCTFDHASGALLEETHNRWDPNTPEIVNIGASGSATIDLGIILTIPVSADTGRFSGTIIMHADTAGISAQYTISVTNTITDVTDDRGTVVKQYLLDQNYPNPFNPNTTIRFSLQSSQYVMLKVYDALGREVQALINERKERGIYEVLFSAHDLVSGIYYYRLHAGTFSETKKLVLTR